MEPSIQVRISVHHDLICCLCHGVLLEHSTKCNAMEARRMFASCMFRSGTIPTLVRSDMGP